MEKRKYRSYTIEQVKENASKVYSLASLLKSLDLKEAGGNFANMKRILQKNEIDCSHWTGQAWNRDQRLKDWSEYTRVENFKKHLIQELGHKCTDCQNSKWFNNPIPLEVHHIDGDRTNNKFENLQLLCCNCHAMTDNWRNKKRKED